MAFTGDSLDSCDRMSWDPPWKELTCHFPLYELTLYASLLYTHPKGMGCSLPENRKLDWFFLFFSFIKLGLREYTYMYLSLLEKAMWNQWWLLFDKETNLNWEETLGSVTGLRWWNGPGGRFPGILSQRMFYQQLVHGCSHRQCPWNCYFSPLSVSWHPSTHGFFFSMGSHLI